MKRAGPVLIAALSATCASAVKPQWGPLAVVRTDAGMEAREEGRLVLTDECAFIERQGERMLLVWPVERTKWDPTTAEVSFERFDGQIVSVRDGQDVVLGGGGSSEAEDGLSGEEWAAQFDWVASPAPGCVGEARWLVSDVLPD
jgi:hypothetical protein